MLCAGQLQAGSNTESLMRLIQRAIRVFKVAGPARFIGALRIRELQRDELVQNDGSGTGPEAHGSRVNTLLSGEWR